MAIWFDRVNIRDRNRRNIRCPSLPESFVLCPQSDSYIRFACGAMCWRPTLATFASPVNGVPPVVSSCGVRPDGCGGKFTDRVLGADDATRR